ncbi:MAG: hypothetical protein ACXAD7_01485 [Candidatus Kariarchaeaceae archaeon]|jgi:SepF-like predicted cell division protein (DUF552 family)
MVDPVSLVLITGAAAAGAIAGKISNKEVQEAQPVEENLKPIINHNNIHFVSVKNEIHPEQIISLAAPGQAVFINIKAILLNPQVLSRFVKKLKYAAALNSLILNQVSNDLLYLTDKNQSMQIHTLSAMKKNDPSDIDQFIQSMAS